MIAALDTEGFAGAAAPLIRWLREHMHPHAYALVDNERAELLEGMTSCGESDAPAKVESAGTSDMRPCSQWSTEDRFCPLSDAMKCGTVPCALPAQPQ